MLSGGLSAGIDLETFGPGDVTGFDPGAVIGAFPRPGTTDAEPENLVSVEFDLPELPWLLTPARAEADRLRPWLMLVVLDASGPSAVAEPLALPTRCFASIDLTAAQVADQLPDLSESWCWAHSQLLTDKPHDSAAALADAPLLNLSRIVCPRRLEPMKSYRACLVPSFAQGVERGLGRVPARDAPLQPAWDFAAAEAVTLPVYHHWTFSTGPAGDFESLARSLKPLRCPDGIGGAELALSEAFPEPDGRERSPLPLAGVLLPGRAPPPGLETVGEDIRDALRLATNSSAGLAIPIYGGAHAQVASLSADAPRWLAEVNLDPRMRIAAGLGADVVRSNQEAFVQACWEQAGAIDEVNRLLDRGRLSIGALGRLAGRIAALPPEHAVAIARPLLDRIKLGEGTVRSAIARSSLPDGLFAAPFRRLANPRRAAVRLAARRLGVDRDTGLARIASRGLSPATPGGFRMPPPSEGGRQPAQPTPPHPRVAAAIQTLHTNARLGARDPDAKPIAFELDSALAALARCIEPRRTVAARVGAMIETDTAEPPGGATLARITIAPELPEPAFLRLQEADPSIFLPGADGLPFNSITLLDTNRRFIEAFMVGLNHEMNRELHWRGFPVDMRGTPFRHFWDWGDGSADIAPISEWRSSTPLGGNGGSPDTSGALVLVVRSPILSRFPGTVVAAWRAESRRGRNRLKSDPVHGDDPLACDYLRAAFQGQLSADMAFAGFALDRAEVEAGAGWYFVFEQQWTQPRFGFESGKPGDTPAKPASWLDARWIDVGVEPGCHIAPNGLLAGHTAQGVTFAANAGHFAAAALKRPFRLAIHGRHLLAAEAGAP